MESTVSSGEQNSSQMPSSNNSRGRNRRRNGRRDNQAPSFRSGHLAHDSRGVETDSPPPVNGTSTEDTRQSHRGTGIRRGTERRNRNSTRATTSTTLMHHFSGQLTGGSSSGAQANHNLRGSAPTFVPSQISLAQASQTSRPSSAITTSQPKQRKNSLNRSTASDLGTRIHEDIAHGLYECSICTSEVRRKNKVWSCTICWTVFHLTCVEQWSKKQRLTAAAPRLQDGELPPPFQWRCPGCNLPKDDIPLFYGCWCGKERDPRGISGVPPHSCGQTCSKLRTSPKSCPHPCELTCHAGPCPPCSHMGPVQSCFCGKESLSRRCVETDYEAGWSCDATCGELLPCGEHLCSKPCHEGLCGSCDIEIDARCYCGKQKTTLRCSDKDEERESAISIQSEGAERVERWKGTFDCKSACRRVFDCGYHTCEKICHSQDAQPAHCPRSPDVVNQCPCGRTLLRNLLQEPRNSCKDPIPCCENICSKALPCGHLCRSRCHSEFCPPCTNTVKITCRCGRIETAVSCHQQPREPLMCLRLCKAKLSCGRHECGEHCCPGEKHAQERASFKRKLRPLTTMDNIEAEHICTRICGRQLKCGSHECPELCHKGPCGSCREAIFEELPCHCGKTVLQPPLPCGTGPPLCRFECERPKDCGHPQVSHNCHGDSESCPKCPFLVEKACMCKKKTLKNQPCFLADVRCGEICGKKLRCGSHTCRKPCHRPGECEGSGSPCQQACGEPKKSCGHPCESVCHSPFACKEDKPCPSKLIITCDCQHLKTETKCLATRNSEGNKNKSLKCDDECARLQRNHQLALALNIDPAHQDDHIPYAAETLRLYQEDQNWAQEREKELRVFAADDEARRLRFKPMKSHRRSFLHALADDFGLDSESLDPEPHRHVCIFKTPRFVKAPMKILADCIRIRARLAAGTPLAPNNAALNPATRTKQAATNVPYNGFILSAPRFALTVDDVATAISSVQSAILHFSIEFLPSEEVVLKANPVDNDISSQLVEDALKTLTPAIGDTILSKKLAASVTRCALDSSLNVLRREGQGGSSNDGWSKVAARAAGSKSASRLPPQPTALGRKTAFTVLSSSSKAKEKSKQAKVQPTEVVDDWEEEMNKEFEAEAKDKSEHQELHAEPVDDGDAGEDAVEPVATEPVATEPDAAEPVATEPNAAEAETLTPSQEQGSVAAAAPAT